MYKKAVKQNLTFVSSNTGIVSISDLYALPLKEVDKMYQQQKKILRDADGDSLLETGSKDHIRELKCEILRDVIETRLDENAKRTNDAAVKSQLRRIQDLRMQRNDAAINDMSDAELDSLEKELTEKL